MGFSWLETVALVACLIPACVQEPAEAPPLTASQEQAAADREALVEEERAAQQEAQFQRQRADEEARAKRAEEVDAAIAASAKRVHNSVPSPPPEAEPPAESAEEPAEDPGIAWVKANCKFYQPESRLTPPVCDPVCTPQVRIYPCPEYSCPKGAKPSWLEAANKQACTTHRGGPNRAARGIEPPKIKIVH